MANPNPSAAAITPTPHGSTSVVRFENVGAQHVTWEERIAWPITEAAIVRAVRLKGALGSRDISASEDSEYTGRIFAGVFRLVGTYTILPASGGRKGS
jgi:hypothetical protein